jgi:hypothetical protein
VGDAQVGRDARANSAERPALAKEIGIGRPDLPNGQDHGLVDVNNACAWALAASSDHRDSTPSTRLVAPAIKTIARSNSSNRLPVNRANSLLPIA